MKIFDGYLLVSDMDGTLLNSKGKLSEENKKAIEYFVDNGGYNLIYVSIIYFSS